jgi:hypothetical protein
VLLFSLQLGWLKLKRSATARTIDSIEIFFSAPRVQVLQRLMRHA